MNLRIASCQDQAVSTLNYVNDIKKCKNIYNMGSADGHERCIKMFATTCLFCFSDQQFLLLMTTINWPNGHHYQKLNYLAKKRVNHTENSNIPLNLFRERNNVLL